MQGLGDDEGELLVIGMHGDRGRQSLRHFARERGPVTIASGTSAEDPPAIAGNAGAGSKPWSPSNARARAAMRASALSVWLERLGVTTSTRSAKATAAARSVARSDCATRPGR
jgi:hypothetical protein